MPTYRFAVDLAWTYGTGSPGVNVWHGRTPDFASGGLTSVTAMTEAVRIFYSSVNQLFPDGTTISFSGEVAGVGDDAGDTATVPGWSVGGIGGAGGLPPANQMIVNWLTGTGGRSGRGRTFIGPLSYGAAEGNGTPVEANRADLEAAAATLIGTSLSDLNGALGVYSRTQNVFRDFQTATVPNLFAVLRSRRD